MFPHRYRSFMTSKRPRFSLQRLLMATSPACARSSGACIRLLQPSPYAFLRRGPETVRELAKHTPYYRLHKQDEILALLRMLAHGLLTPRLPVRSIHVIVR